MSTIDPNQGLGFSRLEKYIEPEFGVEGKNAAQVLGSKVCTKLIRLGHLAKTIFQKKEFSEWINNKEIIGSINFSVVTLEGKSELEPSDASTLNSLTRAIDAVQKQMKKGGKNDEILKDLKTKIEALANRVPKPEDVSPPIPTDSTGQVKSILGISITNEKTDETQTLSRTASVVIQVLQNADVAQLKKMDDAADELKANVSDELKKVVDEDEELIYQIINDYESDPENLELIELKNEFTKTKDKVLEASNAYLAQGHIASAHDLVEAVVKSNQEVLDAFNPENTDSASRSKVLKKEVKVLQEALEKVKKEDQKREVVVEQILTEVITTPEIPKGISNLQGAWKIPFQETDAKNAEKAKAAAEKKAEEAKAAEEERVRQSKTYAAIANKGASAPTPTKVESARKAKTPETEQAARKRQFNREIAQERYQSLKKPVQPTTEQQSPRPKLKSEMIPKPVRTTQPITAPSRAKNAFDALEGLEERERVTGENDAKVGEAERLKKLEEFQAKTVKAEMSRRDGLSKKQLVEELETSLVGLRDLASDRYGLMESLGKRLGGLSADNVALTDAFKKTTWGPIERADKILALIKKGVDQTLGAETEWPVNIQEAYAKALDFRNRLSEKK